MNEIGKVFLVEYQLHLYNVIIRESRPEPLILNMKDEIVDDDELVRFVRNELRLNNETIFIRVVLNQEDRVLSIMTDDQYNKSTPHSSWYRVFRVSVPLVEWMNGNITVSNVKRFYFV